MAAIRKRPLSITTFLAAPSAPAVTPTGGVAGAYSYKLVALNASGQGTAASSAGTTASGPTTLNSTHYNTIDPTGSAASGVVSWDVYRTAGGAAHGKIGNVLNDGLTTLRDDGLVADGTTAPASNATGFGDALDVGDLDGFTAYVNGTFSGSIQMQMSSDAGATWHNQGSALTGTGFIDVSSRGDLFRAKMTAYTSGTPGGAVRGLFATQGA